MLPTFILRFRGGFVA